MYDFCILNRNTYKCYNYVYCKSDFLFLLYVIVCEDDINRNPAYEQGNTITLVNYNTSILLIVFVLSVMLQRVVLSENQAYASIRNEREHNSTIRIYENMQMHS